LQTENFLNDLKKRNPSLDKPVFVFEQQKTQSEEQLICEAIRKTFIGLIEIDKLERKPAPLSELTVG
jgi:altronate hydrolase